MTKISDKVVNIFKKTLKREDAVINYSNGSWTIFFPAKDDEAVSRLHDAFDGKLLNWNSETIEDDGFETYISFKLDNTKLAG